jgi:lipid-binding SYLF domain-containing protein
MFQITRGVVGPVLMTLLLFLPAPFLRADNKAAIDAGSAEALVKLRLHSSQAGELLDKAAGVLVFPDVVKMGFGVGGEYGEGSLLVPGKPTAYFVTAGASFGLQVGIQTKSEVILFMTEEALKRFQNSAGWKVGVDGSVTVAKLGADGSFDSNTLRESIVGFIFSNKGLMYNLTLEGSKITRIAR